MDNLNKYYEKNYAKFGAKFQRNDLDVETLDLLQEIFLNSKVPKKIKSKF